VHVNVRVRVRVRVCVRVCVKFSKVGSILIVYSKLSGKLRVRNFCGH